ncbi:hypothetical protein BOX15_Mlig026933g2 [Macrostomum lignano]|uniref:Androgen-dependent TFPI-regulating protein n=1 Tax=Macrostomum lignano TaxID=282301 RepID=A0A267FWS3_9PLAT|nr:hypothetical protein BOX15_Mlig026933g2 [Macrostomum lignano]
MKTLFQNIIRTALVSAYVLVLYYNFTYVRFPSRKNPSKNFGGKYEYLTVLNLVFLTASLTLSFLCELLPIGLNSNPVHKLKGILNAASATISMFVCLAFWSIYAINRELVFPAVLDSIIPPWHNHAIHTTVLPVSLISYLLTPKSHAPRFATLMCVASGLVVCYTLWIYVIYLNTGRWVYPVLAVLGAPARAAFIAACALSMAPFAFAAHWIKSRFDAWKTDAAKAVKREKRKQKAKARKAQ